MYIQIIAKTEKLEQKTKQNKLCGFLVPKWTNYTDRWLAWQAKLLPTFAGGGFCVVSAMNPYGCWSQFSRPEPLLFHQVAPQLFSHSWVNPVPDPLLLRKSGSVVNRSLDLWICSQDLWLLHHRLSTCVKQSLPSMLMNNFFKRLQV
jgi:hypothetical protein